MTVPDLTADLREFLLARISEYELDDHAEAILAVARPELRLELDGELAPDAPPGRSRIGGDPDLPEGVPWPVHEGHRFSFMAQLDLASLGIPVGWPLPQVGTLSVFMGDDEERFEVPHRVLYFPPGSALTRRAPPEDIPCADEAHAGLEVRALRAKPAISLPGYGSALVVGMNLDEDTLDRYLVLEQKLGGGYGKLLGHDHDVDELPSQVRARQVLLQDRDFDWLRAHPAEHDAEAARWAPLIELGSCHDVGLCMWDYYSFLVLIPWEDLAAGRWDRTHGMLART